MKCAHSIQLLPNSVLTRPRSIMKSAVTPHPLHLEGAALLIKPYITTINPLLILPRPPQRALRLLRYVQPAPYQPAQAARLIVDWFAARPHIGLQILPLRLPFAALLSTPHPLSHLAQRPPPPPTRLRHRRHPPRPSLIPPHRRRNPPRRLHPRHRRPPPPHRLTSALIPGPRLLGAAPSVFRGCGF